MGFTRQARPTQVKEQKYSRPCEKVFTKKPLSSIPSRFRSCVVTQKARVAVRKPFAPIRSNFAVMRQDTVPKRTFATPVRQTRSLPTKVAKTTVARAKTVVDFRTSNHGFF